METRSFYMTQAGPLERKQNGSMICLVKQMDKTKEANCGTRHTSSLVHICNTCNATRRWCIFATHATLRTFKFTPPFPPSSICDQSQRRYRIFLCIFSCTSTLCSMPIHSTECTSILLLSSYSLYPPLMAASICKKRISFAFLL